MSETLHDKDEAKESSGGMKPLLIAALLMGAIAAPAGWFLGSQITTSAPNSAESAGEDKSAAKKAKSKGANSAITVLEPVLTNLREPEGVWVRLETALVVKDGQELEAEQQAEIVSDFIALVHQVTLAQIKGATGLMNLREDLLDRARIRSGGQVSALLISGLVIE